MSQYLSLCKESQQRESAKADKENVESGQFLANLVGKSFDCFVEFSAEN